MDEGIATTTRVIPVRGVSSLGFLDGTPPPNRQNPIEKGVPPWHQLGSKVSQSGFDCGFSHLCTELALQMVIWQQHKCKKLVLVSFM